MEIILAIKLPLNQDDKPNLLLIPIFDLINLSDIYKLTYLGTKLIKDELSRLVKTIGDLIKTSADVQFIGPTLSSLINAHVHNDSHFVDLANSVSKIVLAKRVNNGSDDNSWINSDLLQLLTRNSLNLLEDVKGDKISLLLLKKKKALILKGLNPDDIEYIINLCGLSDSFDDLE